MHEYMDWERDYSPSIYLIILNLIWKVQFISK